MSKEKVNPDIAYSIEKARIFDSYCNAFFTRLQSMFVYTGMPDSIPVQWLEEYLLKNGSCAIAEIGGVLYALNGSAGGELDVYFQPTRWVGANAGLPVGSQSYDLEIGKDCVWAKNDYNASGLTPMISRYCGLMTENFLTTRIADINMRMSQIMSAPDDTTAQSAKQYLKDVESGKLGVIGENAFFDGLKVQSASVGSGDYMIQFIELQQYIKGSLYNELGLDANYNMKREALSQDEIALNDDALMPLIDDMLKARRTFCSEMNEMFGLDVSVDYGSSWHANSVEKIQSVEKDMGADPETAANMSDEISLDSNEDANSSAENDIRAEVAAPEGTGDVDDTTDDGEGVSQLAEEGGPNATDGDDESDDSEEASPEESEKEASEESNDEEQTAETGTDESSENDSEDNSGDEQQSGDDEEETEDAGQSTEEEGDAEAKDDDKSEDDESVSDEQDTDSQLTDDDTDDKKEKKDEDTK